MIMFDKNLAAIVVLLAILKFAYPQPTARTYKDF